MRVACLIATALAFEFPLEVSVSGCGEPEWYKLGDAKSNDQPPFVNDQVESLSVDGFKAIPFVSVPISFFSPVPEAAAVKSKLAASCKDALVTFRLDSGGDSLYAATPLSIFRHQSPDLAKDQTVEVFELTWPAAQDRPIGLQYLRLAPGAARRRLPPQQRRGMLQSPMVVVKSSSFGMTAPTWPIASKTEFPLTVNEMGVVERQNSEAASPSLLQTYVSELGESYAVVGHPRRLPAEQSTVDTRS